MKQNQLSKVEVERSQKLIIDAREAGYRFMKTELVLARTFIEVALTSHDPVRIDHNFDDARKALMAVERFAQRLDLQDWQIREISSEAQDLRAIMYGG